jgi:hypothetical protein
VTDTNGEPRYRVSRIPMRLIFRWAVMCGEGTAPAYTTWRFLQALRICSLLENAYADGHYVGSGQYAASKEVERLRQQVDGYDAAIASRDLELERLRPALQVARHAILEFGHAQANGPAWYTRGKDGMYAQVRQWLQRGMEAIDQALDPPCSCPPDRPATAGHTEGCPRHLRPNDRSYSKAFVLELLGYLTGAIPELHAFESGKMISLLEEFEHRQEEPKP